MGLPRLCALAPRWLPVPGPLLLVAGTTVRVRAVLQPLAVGSPYYQCGSLSFSPTAFAGDKKSSGSTLSVSCIVGDRPCPRTKPFEDRDKVRFSWAFPTSGREPAASS